LINISCCKHKGSEKVQYQIGYVGLKCCKIAICCDCEEYQIICHGVFKWLLKKIRGEGKEYLGEIGDKIPESELVDVKAALEKLKETAKGDNTEALKADTEALEQAFYKVSEKLYAQQQQQGGAGGSGVETDANGEQTYYDPGYEDKTDK
jgi:hypothetical protein